MNREISIFDTHAHYDDEVFDSDREELLLGMESRGVSRIVNVGASMKMSRNSIELAKKYPFMYAAVGVHPDDAAEINNESLNELRLMAAYEKCVAIGEIGLDYHYEDANPEIQKAAFEAQINLAHELKMPIIVHSRDAAKDTYDLMKGSVAKELRGVVHCFSYSVEEAKKYLEWDYFIGVGGVLTFKNGRKLREVVASIPLDRIVLETDAPYLCPMRGSRNDSSYISEVVNVLSETIGVDREKILGETYKNACRLYGLLP